jgi:hypothetical protein
MNLRFLKKQSLIFVKPEFKIVARGFRLNQNRDQFIRKSAIDGVTG